MIWTPDPHEVRERETYSFPKLQGEAKAQAIAEWRRIAPLIPRLLALPYEWKLEHAQAIIAAAMAKDVRPMLAWSGGQGSTVMLHLVRAMGYTNVAVMFSDTGVEFPETRRFVRRVAAEWHFDLHIARPERGMSFWRIVREQGWPMLGKYYGLHSADYYKQLAEQRARERDEALGIAPLWSPEIMNSITTSPKVQMAEAVRISAVCCYHLKEKPQLELQRHLGCDMVFLGIQAEESDQRRKNYVDFGELYFARKTRTWKALPLALWTRQDLKRYEQENSLPINPLYTMGYKRNGCWPCMMAIAFPDNHLAQLRKNHPKLHRFLMTKVGAGEAIARLKAIKDGLPPDAYLEYFGGLTGLTNWYEKRPCWFNKI